jgi:hypothetical protein
MSHLAGEGQSEGGRFGFDRRVRIEFHGSRISSDGGLLLFRELDDVLGLHELMGDHLVDTRTGHNRLQSMVAFRASRSTAGLPAMRTSTTPTIWPSIR